MENKIGGGKGLIKVIRDQSPESFELMRRKLTGTCTVKERLLGHNTRCYASDPNSFEKETGKTAIIIATETGQFDKVQLLLEQPTIDVTLLDRENKSALYYAGGRIHELLFNYFIQHIPINRYNRIFFYNHGDEHTFERLLNYFISLRHTENIEEPEFKYKVNTKIDAEITLFDYAILKNIYSKYIQILLDNGASLDLHRNNVEIYILKIKNLSIDNQRKLIQNMIVQKEIKKIMIIMIEIIENPELFREIFKEILPHITSKPELINFIVRNKSLYMICLQNTYNDIIKILLTDLDAYYKYNVKTISINNLETQDILYNHLIFKKDYIYALEIIFKFITNEESKLSKINQILSLINDNTEILLTMPIIINNLFEYSIKNQKINILEFLLRNNLLYSDYNIFTNQIVNLEQQQLLFNYYISKKYITNAIKLTILTKNKEFIPQIIPYIDDESTHTQLNEKHLLDICVELELIEDIKKIIKIRNIGLRYDSINNCNNREILKVLYLAFLSRYNDSSVIINILKDAITKSTPQDFSLFSLVVENIKPNLIYLQHNSKNMMIYALEFNDINSIKNLISKNFDVTESIFTNPIVNVDIQQLLFSFFTSNNKIDMAIKLIIFTKNKELISYLIPYLNEKNINTTINKEYILDILIQLNLTEFIKEVVKIKTPAMHLDNLFKCKNNEIIKILYLHIISNFNNQLLNNDLLKDATKRNTQDFNIFNFLVNNIKPEFIDTLYNDQSMLYYALQFNDDISIQNLLNKKINIFSKNNQVNLIKLLNKGYNIFNYINSTNQNIFYYFNTYDISIIYDIYIYLIKNDDIDNAFLILCTGRIKTEDMNTLLLNPKLFIDCFDIIGRNGLMIAINYNDNVSIIQKLLERNININAIDVFGDTPLHYALKKNNEIIITLLCSQPNIIPFIPNNNERTAIDVSAGGVYSQLINETVGINRFELLNKPWKGVTLDYIKKFDYTYLIGIEGAPIEYEKSTYCPNCLQNTGKIDNACNHIKHQCNTDLLGQYKNVMNGLGGFPPYMYRNVDSMGNFHLCHVCAEFNYSRDSPNHDSWYTCRNGWRFKYYKLYLIIQKFIELQPKEGIESRLTIKQAMDQIIEAGKNAVYNRFIFEPIVVTILATRTFLPSVHPFTNERSFEQLYPPIGRKIKKIPNMRRMKDVIANNLMPQIKLYNEIKNEDGTSKNPIEYDSPECIFTDEKSRKFIVFNHREHILANNYKIINHDTVSIEGFMGSFNLETKDTTKENFGKCILYSNKQCYSYLYPEELKLLVNNEVISHNIYIKYRDEFFKSDKIQIENSPEAKNYFLFSQVAQGGSKEGRTFKEKYLKYKAKYLALKKS